MLRSAIVIDSGQSLRDLLGTLDGLPNATDLVFRVHDGLDWRWFTYCAGDLFNAGVRRADRLDYKLREILQFDSALAATTYQMRQMDGRRLEHASGVLLDGAELVGVLEPEPQAQAFRGGASFDVPASAPASAPAAPPAASAPSESIVRRGARLDKPKAADADSDVAYPRLDAPDSVASGDEFELVIGLGSQQQSGVAGGPLALPDKDSFDLVVQVTASGFGMPRGVRRFLHVERARPEQAEARVPLVAPELTSGVLPGHLIVDYSYEGHLLGRAWREIVVTAPGAQATVGPSETLATPLAKEPNVAAPDLLVMIQESEDGGKLEWRFDSPHTLEIPNRVIESKLRHGSAQAFAVAEIKTVAEKDGTKFIDEQILGIARNVSTAMPNEFWNLLEQAWKAQNKTTPDRVPSLLLVSSEPYIPWELASTEKDWIDQELLDDRRPPLLGAQLRVGRWIPPGPRTPRGIQRPVVPPAARIAVGRIAAVVGDYLAERGDRPLPMAKEEGKALSLRYDAYCLSATEESLSRLLEGRLEENGSPVRVDAVHFACHGEVDPDNHRHNGIVVSDKVQRLSPMMIRGANLGRESEPFVFMNACQLGFSSEVLADYGGMAGAFLREGCRGFVAPLWSVDDQLAHDTALAFYDKALEDGVEVAEIMRELRSNFDLGLDTPASTHLAYVFYGHPNLILERRQ